MATAIVATRTVADLLDELGGISPSRVLLRPFPGQATEADVLEVSHRGKKLCELIDGVLVEKAMGFVESALAGLILSLLRAFVDPPNLGIVTGADGVVRLFPGLVRIPDVAFTSWDRIPGRRYPEAPIPDLVPDLAIEVLSESNTPAEMERKLGDYFRAGVRLVWMVAPKTRTVRVCTPEGEAMRDASQTLDGGDVLPGFVLDLASLFAELDRHG